LVEVEVEVEVEDHDHVHVHDHPPFIPTLSPAKRSHC
jgi:hypothetical protein